ncbi:hypothetical protein [Streptomyces carpaticus]|uniref:hypothetical protein n=1 Tax=Streptomyces carpaticus TaxID=285558 RepID=UPI0031FA2A4D
MPYAWRPGMRVTAERLRGGTLCGTVTLNPSVARTQPVYAATFWFGEQTISFPPGFFTSAPVISVTGRTATPGTVIECSYTSVSVNGVTLCVARSNTTSTIVDWIAEQPL